MPRSERTIREAVYSGMAVIVKSYGKGGSAILARCDDCDGQVVNFDDIVLGHQLDKRGESPFDRDLFTDEVTKKIPQVSRCEGEIGNDRAILPLPEVRRILFSCTKKKALLPGKIKIPEQSSTSLALAIHILGEDIITIDEIAKLSGVAAEYCWRPESPAAVDSIRNGVGLIYSFEAMMLRIVGPAMKCLKAKSKPLHRNLSKATSERKKNEIAAHINTIQRIISRLKVKENEEGRESTGGDDNAEPETRSSDIELELLKPFPAQCSIQNIQGMRDFFSWISCGDVVAGIRQTDVQGVSDLSDFLESDSSGQVSKMLSQSITICSAGKASAEPSPANIDSSVSESHLGFQGLPTDHAVAFGLKCTSFRLALACISEIPNKVERLEAQKQLSRLLKVAGSVSAKYYSLVASVEEKMLARKNGCEDEVENDVYIHAESIELDSVDRYQANWSGREISEDKREAVLRERFANWRKERMEKISDASDHPAHFNDEEGPCPWTAGIAMPGKKQVRPAPFPTTSAAKEPQRGAEGEFSLALFLLSIVTWCRKKTAKDEKKRYGDGLITISCGCKFPKLLGFLVMQNPEGQTVILVLLLGFFAILPKIVVYDFGCHLFSCAANFFPWVVAVIQFVTDRFHERNHNCAPVFSAAFWRSLLGGNTVSHEQNNRPIRKMENSLRGLTRDNYITVVLYEVQMNNLAAHIRRKRGLPAGSPVTGMARDLFEIHPCFCCES